MTPHVVLVMHLRTVVRLDITRMNQNTYQDGKRDLCLHLLLKAGGTSLKPLRIVKVDGQARQRDTAFVDGSSFRNAFEGTIAT